MTGIVIAHLAGNPQFDELARHYQDDLARFRVAESWKFGKLVECLRGQSRPA
jgi:hypothetical protein